MRRQPPDLCSPHPSLRHGSFPKQDSAAPSSYSLPPAYSWGSQPPGGPRPHPPHHSLVGPPSPPHHSPGATLRGGRVRDGPGPRPAGPPDPGRALHLSAASGGGGAARARGGLFLRSLWQLRCPEIGTQISQDASDQKPKMQGGGLRAAAGSGLYLARSHWPPPVSQACLSSGTLLSCFLDWSPGGGRKTPISPGGVPGSPL